MAHYLDTSALVKLVVAEPETAALREWLGAGDRQPLSSDLARTELLRAVRRAAPERAVGARAVLDSLLLVEITPEVFDEAGRLDPPGLRALDALHLAAALSLREELAGMVTYDERLRTAARAHGVDAIAPGGR